MNLSLRWASTADQAWVDAQYASIDFKPSDVTQDQVLIAYWDGQAAGLGRLVPGEAETWELGGMFVLPDFRRKGIANRIVQHLIDAAPVAATLYCIPFVHLTNFYQSFGFQPVSEEELQKVPTAFLDKWHWCNTHYPDEADLLVLNK